MKIGFIGLGRMGHHVAANLLKAGHSVTVWNRRGAGAGAGRKRRRRRRRRRKTRCKATRSSPCCPTTR